MKSVTLGSGLALLAALGAGGLVSSPALAVTSGVVPDTLTIVSDSFTPAVVSDGTVTNPDRLTVVTDTPTGSTISALDGDILSSTGTDTTFDPVFTATPSPVAEPDGSTETTWTAEIPFSPTLPSAGLWFGNGYVVDLTAQWADRGAASSAQAPSSFDFDIMQAIRLSASNTDLTYGSTSATLSGQITDEAPDGTSIGVAGNHQVTFLVDGQALPNIAIAPSDGAFTGPTLSPRTSESVVATALSYDDGLILAGTSNTVNLTVTDAVPEFSIASSTVTETYGQYPPLWNASLSTATVSGSVKIRSAPFADQWIEIAKAPTGATPTNGLLLGTGETDSSGDFDMYGAGRGQGHRAVPSESARSAGCRHCRQADRGERSSPDGHCQPVGEAGSVLGPVR